MQKVLNSNDLASLPALVALESRMPLDRPAFLEAINISPFLFEVQNDQGEVVAVLLPYTQTIQKIVVRTDRVNLVGVATTPSNPNISAAQQALYFDLSETEPYPNSPLLGGSPGTAAAPSIVQIRNGGIANNLLTVRGEGDAQSNTDLVAVTAANVGLFNGATWDRQRSASAAALAAQSGIGSALVALPGTVPTTSNPAAGAQASASRAAGGAGVRHICTALSFGFSATTALAGITTLTINLRDGATGAGGVLRAWTFTLPAAAQAPFSVNLSGLSIPGSAATAMTLESSAAIGNLMVFTSFDSYDAS
jgi:hypothetical protein